MATIFERMSIICRSKASALLAKFENPAELIDQTIIDAKKEYAENVTASAEVFVAEKQALTDLQAIKKEKAKYDKVAEKAVEANNDDDARLALQKAAEIEVRVTKAEARYATMHKSADDLRHKLTELKDGIAAMEQRAAEIKADMAIAEATKKISSLTGSVKTNAFETFDRLASKAEKERMAAESLSDLETNAMRDEDAELLRKYTGPTSDPSIEEKLAALKAKLGKTE